MWLTYERGRTWPAWPRLCWRCDRHKRTLHGSAAETEEDRESDGSEFKNQLRVISPQMSPFWRYEPFPRQLHIIQDIHSALWCEISFLASQICMISCHLLFSSKKSLKSCSSKAGNHIKEQVCSLRFQELTELLLSHVSLYELLWYAELWCYRYTYC